MEALAKSTVPDISRDRPKRIALILGGGGMRGLAHIGVLKVLEKLHIQPSEYIGTSVGSLFAALAAGGLTTVQMERIAFSISKRDILDYNWVTLLRQGSHTRSLLIGRKFHSFVKRILPVDDFRKLKTPLYINTVDINHGNKVVWGEEGYRDAFIHDCICASCAIPGIFPPMRINGQYHVDGGVIDPLPIKIAVAHGADVIIAVHLESSETFANNAIQNEGFLAALSQAQSIISQTLLSHQLAQQNGTPLILLEPRVWRFGMFEFDQQSHIIEEGMRCALEVLPSHPLMLQVLYPERQETKMPPTGA